MCNGGRALISSTGEAKSLGIFRWLPAQKVNSKRHSGTQIKNKVVEVVESAQDQGRLVAETGEAYTMPMATIPHS